MANIKRIILSALLLFAGILLSLAGLSLIALSLHLILYLGLGLIILGLVNYFLKS